MKIDDVKVGDKVVVCTSGKGIFGKNCLLTDVMFEADGSEFTVSYIDASRNYVSLNTGDDERYQGLVWDADWIEPYDKVAKVDTTGIDTMLSFFF